PASLTALALVVVSARCSGLSVCSSPNTPAPPAPSMAPAAHISESPRRCRSARTACRPRSRLPCTGAPRGRAGTRWCGNTAWSASLGAARSHGETPTFLRGPRAGARAGRGAGRGARDAVEKGGRVWLGDAGTRLPRGRPRPPRRVVSLPTPHSPARVRVGARAAASSRSRGNKEGHTWKSCEPDGEQVGHTKWDGSEGCKPWGSTWINRPSDVISLS
uniref:Uncharacterized protein n=1 Tax=Peromyscus maniculatus bairdii TaxID=230844 RepID=A0A8C8UNL8_PERMB